MGKKARRERVEKRETFAAKRSKAKRKNLLIAAGAMAAVGAIVAYAAISFVSTAGNLPGAPPGAGPLGGEHEHASILTLIHGDRFGYSAQPYQVQDNWIHFENQDGTTIHRHAANVTLGYLFDTLDVELNDECYVFPDNALEFCTTDEHSLKFYVNGEKVPGISEYVVEDGDRILISYGGEDDDEIAEQLARLGDQPILS
ncbi:MAG: protein-disulfide isomerase [Thaumarchaeota archaeon]|nr:protein-disulfide isomerase [Nitrososphaerota archaeon]